MDIFPLGIDISKSKFDVAVLLPDGRLHHRVFLNSAAGFQQLSTWLSKRKVNRVQVVGYSCVDLIEAGKRLSVTGPRVLTRSPELQNKGYVGLPPPPFLNSGPALMLVFTLMAYLLSLIYYE